MNNTSEVTMQQRILCYIFAESNWGKKWQTKKEFYIDTVKKATYCAKERYTRETIDNILSAFDLDWESFYNDRKLIKRIKKNRIYKRELLSVYLKKYETIELPREFKIAWWGGLFLFSFLLYVSTSLTNGLLNHAMKNEEPIIRFGFLGFAFRLVSDCYSYLIEKNGEALSFYIRSKKVEIRKLYIVFDKLLFGVSYMCYAIAFLELLSFLFFVVVAVFGS